MEHSIACAIFVYRVGYCVLCFIVDYFWLLPLAIRREAKEEEQKKKNHKLLNQESRLHKPFVIISRKMPCIYVYTYKYITVASFISAKYMRAYITHTSKLLLNHEMAQRVSWIHCRRRRHSISLLYSPLFYVFFSCLCV